MKAGKKLKAAVLACVVLAVVFGGYKYYTVQKTNTQSANQELVEVERRTLKSTVSATGTIRPVDSVEVSSKITARIKSVLVKENDQVQAGQIVAVLDGKDYEAKHDQAEYKVTNMKAKYNRTEYLHSIGAKSDEEMEDASYEYDTAQSVLAETESDLNETIITAPMDGMVVGEPKTPGTMAVQGNNNPTVIMRLADLSHKQIKAKVDETDIGNIRVGQQATFTVDAFNGVVFTAKVAKISQTDVDSSWDTSSTSSSSSSGSGSGSGSSSSSVIYYYVTLDVDDVDNILLPAMTARVEINTGEKDNVLTIPISALKTNADGSYVIRALPDGKTEEVLVETGMYSEEYVEILSGLSEGDQVAMTYKTTQKTSSSSSGHQGPPPM